MSAPVPPKGNRAPRLRSRDVYGVTLRSATDGRDILLNDPDGWEIDHPGLWWDGPAGGDGTGGPFGNPPPGAGWSSSLPAAVTRCTSLIADTLAGLPWQVFRDRERLATPDWISDPQSTRIDQRITAGPVPEWRRSKMEFWSGVITSVLWAGEGMVYIPHRDAAGAPVPPVWQVNPADVDIFDGQYGITAADDEFSQARQEPAYLFAPGELIVIRGLLREGLRGVGVLQAHARDLALAEGIQDFAHNMLQRGIPAGYLKVSSPNLTRQAARVLQEDWMRQHSGRTKKVAVLNATTEFHPLAMDPQALQLMDMRRYSMLDIALLFGIPPYMLGLSQDNNTYANVESRAIEFAAYTLLPYSRRIESALDSEFPRGVELKINQDGLRRADTKTRLESWKIGLEAGIYTIDEVRQKEDLPPLAEVGVTA